MSKAKGRLCLWEFTSHYLTISTLSHRDTNLETKTSKNTIIRCLQMYNIYVYSDTADKYEWSIVSG